MAAEDPTFPMPLGKTAVTESSLGPQELRHAVPASIGHYRIVRVLGEGGMGTVYEAEQDNPRRTVALKVIRARYLSAQLLRRFEQEAQVLGRLQHPGIAQVYEAGTVKDEDGRPLPFFAMEYIQGDPLTDYASLHALGTRQRLELVAKICDAVYHAHQKGIIHRDLKPANILVDKAGQPKILDFGVARATDSDIKHTTMQTDIGQLIGTVPYMSPEQVSGNPDDLDTRSDVYALGVIAYELLSGRLPYNLERKMIHEAVGLIREAEPTRLSSINRSLRGDIETIIAKALEKQKTRRYQSAESFASDIRRYLRDEPIAARPASTWYQLQKFSRRNKGLVSGVAAAFLVLIAGVVGTSLSLRRALSAETRLTGQLAETLKARAAEAEQRRLADEQRDRAIAAEALTKKRAEELQKVADFQAQMFSQVDPAEAGKLLAEDVQAKFAASLKKAGVPESQRKEQQELFSALWLRVNATDAARDLLDRTLLKPAVIAINKHFKDQPLLDAMLCEALSDRYDYLGLYDQAIDLQRRALAIRRMIQGEEHRDTLNAINNLGVLLKERGDLDEAELCYREELEKSRRVMGEDHPDTMVSLNNLGRLLISRDKIDEAEPYLREALERRSRVLGENDPSTIDSIEALGFLLEKQEKYAEAEQYACEVMEWRRRTLGEDHPDTLAATCGFGDILGDEGKWQEAEACYRDSVERTRRVLGDDHPDTLHAIHNLAMLLERNGKPADAEGLYREAAESSLRLLGENNPSTQTELYNLAAALSRESKYAEAEPIFRRVYELRCRTLSPDDPDTVDALYYLGIMLQSQRRWAESESCFREIVIIRTRTLGASDPATLYAINRLGGVLQFEGRSAEASLLLAPIEGDVRKAFAGNHSNHLATFLSSLGAARAATGQYAAAEVNLLEAHKLLAGIATATASERQGAAIALAALYDAWHAAEPGAAHDVQAATWKAKAKAEQ